MLNIPMRLRVAPRDDSDAAETHAWFLPGGDVQRCLSVLKLLPNSAQAHLLLLPGPRSESSVGSCSSAAPGGFLIVPAELPAAHAPESPGGNVQAWTCRADKVYHPADAEIFPAVSDDELQKLFVSDLVVWHPGRGTMAFERSALRRAANLFDMPPPRDVLWMMAENEAPPPLFAGVSVKLPPDPEEKMQSKADDIASTDTRELRQPGDGASHALWKIVAPFGIIGLHGIRALVGLLPGGAAGPTLFDRLSDWTDRQLNNLQNERFREIERLLDLLQKDPDRGLRFALPLVGAGRRGKSNTPGSRLFERTPSYGANRSAEAGDNWNLNTGLRQRLMAQYRAAANREIALKRFDRAAYIFAELLGDWSAAADALERGRSFRDAAAIYRRRLNNPARAAQCLERGELYYDALALYEQEEMHREAGKLHARLGNEDAAHIARERAVQIALRKQEIMLAAEISRDDMRNGIRAMWILEQGWEATNYSEECLQTWFDIAGREAAHKDVRRRITEFNTEQPETLTATKIVKSLVRAAHRYPDVELRKQSGSVALNIIGRRLPVAGYEESQTLLKQYAELRPQDRLLNRDTQKARAAIKPTPRFSFGVADSGDDLTLQCRAMSLPQGPTWINMISVAGKLLTLGIHSTRGDDYIELCRVSWRKNAPESRASVQVSKQIPEYAHLHAISEGVVALFVPMQKLSIVPWKIHSDVEKRMPASSAFPLDVFGMAYGNSKPMHLLRIVNNSPVLELRSKKGHVLRTQNLSPEIGIDDLSLPLRFAGRQKACWIAAGNSIFRATPDKVTRAWQLDSNIQSLSFSAPNTRLRLVAALEEGAVLLIPGLDKEQGMAINFGEAEQYREIKLLRCGLIAACSNENTDIYRIDKLEVELLHRRPHVRPNLIPQQIVQLPDINSFAVLCRDGVLQTFSIEYKR